MINFIWIRNPSLIPMVFLILLLGACSTTGEISTNDPIPAEGEETSSEVMETKLIFALQGFGSDMVSALDLNLKIVEIESKFEYELKLGSVVYEGKAELEWFDEITPENVSRIILYEIPWIENPGDNMYSTAELMNSENGFVLQNTGNSMNSFQILSVDYKYIYFRASK